MCSKNIIAIPENDHNSIESEINLNPIVNHHIIKKGFNTEKIIPAKNAT